jgi:hypothetical protein
MYFHLILAALVLMVLPGDLVTAATPLASSCYGPNCSACDLVQMVNNIIKWLFGIVAIIFTVMMTIAGFGLVTSGGNEVALNNAKEKFKNLIIGLIIVMSAWLLVDTLMRGLLPGNSGQINGTLFWADVECQTQLQPDFVREGSNVTDTAQSLVNTPSGPPGTGLSQAAAEAILPSSISVVSSGSCTDRTQSNCTSLDGVKPQTISRIVQLQQDVGENLVITGGTETGHSGGTYSHSNGYKIDLRTTPQLNAHITENYEHVGGTKWKDPEGNIYYRHGPHDHWDVTVTN